MSFSPSLSTSTKKIFLALLALFFFCSQAAFALIPERRGKQFDTTSGYLLFPAPYELPGLGSGLMVVGYWGNILESNADAFAITMQGDVEGYIGSVDELFIIPEFLYYNRFQMLITSYGINSYSKRGMDTDKDDYNILVGDKYAQHVDRFVIPLFDRRLQLATSRQGGEGRSNKILDAEGDLVVEYDTPQTFEQKGQTNEILLDLTDDYGDPRSGLRVSIVEASQDAADTDSPEYSVIDKFASLYLPMGVNSTWVFHYYTSDASVSRQGNTDLDTLKTNAGYDSCVYASDQTACEAAVIENATNTQSANRYGTAAALGGTNIMRAYPNGRFQAAHAQVIATEFRWNILTEHVSFDWYLLSDVQEAMQVAFFYEQGTVAETKEELGNITRSSYGSGLRLVTGSGSVYRFDLATGEEGAQVNLIFQYPWEPGGM
ncbi:MAG: hypothetical protein QNL04_05685 [SAR324 cluster bacterium]|nr:hypothetical protein [SAR324 cluster bacterium]